MDFLGKQYKMETSENFDEFMKEIGVGLIQRKAANALTPVVVLKKEGDLYNLVFITPIKNNEMKFKIGEEFDEERVDGTKVKSVVTFEGNTMKQTQTAPNGQVVQYTRTFTADLLTVVMTVNGITSTRTFKATN